MLLTLILFASCKSGKNAIQEKSFGGENVVIAHRGAWKASNLPQNSIASLKHAINLHCAGSEFDVRMTADDSLIINHDPQYHDQFIEKTAYADLVRMPLSNGEKLPTLREYLLAGMVKNTSTLLVCEIKPSDISGSRGKLIAEKTITLVRVLGVSKLMVYISFDYAILKRILELEPGANTQYLNGDKSPLTLKADGIRGADYYLSVFSTHPDWIGMARENHIALNAWTVNDLNDMNWLLANKFDFITTNEPELLKEASSRFGAAGQWKLFWQDEFNSDGLPDSAKWGYDTGGNGWGNKELQYYTERDSSTTKVSNGFLFITAHKLNSVDKPYTSARLVTKNKADFHYGKIDIRAKLPAGKGLWPAIWMLGKNIDSVTWPECGEIDIMEHVGYNKDSVFGTAHSLSYNHIKGTQKSRGVYLSDPYNTFHNYSIEWSREKLSFLLDGIVYLEVFNEHKTRSEWPFSQPFYLILNVAVGGNWGGKMGVDNAVFPASMVIDYVRVYQRPE